jgi:hypothetical protein
MNHVREQTGKSSFQQLNEIRHLRTQGGMCGASDYYWYKLYDESYQNGRGPADYLGWRLQGQFNQALNPRNVVLPAWDKCVFATLATSTGLPVVPTRACFHRAKRISASLGIHLTSSADVRKYLCESATFPLFCKPAYSQQGCGAMCLAGYDPDSDKLQLVGGSVVALGSFLNHLEQPIDPQYHRPEAGFLFQQALVPTAEISAVTGWSAISSVRIVCLNDGKRPKPIRAIWKIAVRPNVVDNFAKGFYGNLIADVNLGTGEISRPINRFWPLAQVVDRPSQAGSALQGFRLPNWNTVLDICDRGGAVFPLMKIHHWDIALTKEGPVILELNDLGATEFLQVHGHGLLTPETREFVRQHGDTRTHRWIQAL